MAGFAVFLHTYTQPYLLREFILAEGKGGKDHVLGVPMNPAMHKKVLLIRAQLCAGRSGNQMCDKKHTLTLTNVGLHITTCTYLAEYNMVIIYSL